MNVTSFSVTSHAVDAVHITRREHPNFKPLKHASLHFKLWLRQSFKRRQFRICLTMLRRLALRACQKKKSAHHRISEFKHENE